MDTLYHIGRTARILAITIPFVLIVIVLHLVGSRVSPMLVRRYFEACGGAILKIGQLLAMRYDLLPEEYCTTLGSLLDKGKPVPTDWIKETIRKDLGHSTDELFLYFDPKPEATASVAQVHRATRHDGAEVVVKVMRTGIERMFKVDFRNARMLAWLLDRLHLLGNINVRALVNEQAAMAREELDFRQEAFNAQMMRDRFSNDGVEHYAPVVYFEQCGSSVLTLQRLEGIWMKDLLEIVKTGNPAGLEKMKKLRINADHAARILVQSTLTQWFTHRYFHADPHPANLLVMEGGTLGFIDFGMMGWLDERLWAQQLKLRQYLAAGMIHAAYQTLLDGISPLPSRDLTIFEDRVKMRIRRYLLAANNPHATLPEKSSGRLLVGLLDEIRRAGLHMPTSMVRMYRSGIITDMVMLGLNPSIDWIAILRTYLNDQMREQLETTFDRSNAMLAMSAMLMNVAAAPQSIGDLFDWSQSRLPEYGRSYQHPVTLGEEWGLMTFAYVRMLAFAVAAVVFAAQLFPATTGPFPRINEMLGSMWWLVAAIALFTAAILGRYIKRLRIQYSVM